VGRHAGKHSEHRVLPAVERLPGIAGQFRELRGVGQDLLLLLQRGVLPRLERRSFDLADLKAEELFPLGAVPVLRREIVPLRLEFPVLLVQGGKPGPLGPEMAEFVEDIDVALQVEQHLVLVLAADVDERLADLAEHGHGGQIAVDVDPVLPRAGHHPLDDDLPAGVKPHLLEPRPETPVGPDVEDRLDDGGVLLRADQVRRGPVPEQQADGPDENRLARPRLPRDDVEPLVEGKMEPVDDGEIGDPQFLQHVRSGSSMRASRPSRVSTSGPGDSPSGARRPGSSRRPTCAR